MADVQMYRFNGSAWVEVNPVPAAHYHDDRYYTESESDTRFLRTILGNSVARGSVHRNQTLSGVDGVGALVSQTNMVNLISYLHQQTQVVENSTDGSTWNAISPLSAAIFGGPHEVDSTDIFDIASGIKYWRITLSGNLQYKQLTWLAIRRRYVGSHPIVFAKVEVGNGSTWTTLFQDISISDYVEEYVYLRLNSRSADTHIRITLHTTSTNTAHICRVNGIQLLGFYSNQKQIHVGNIIESTDKQFVSASEKATWNNKISVSSYGDHVPQTGQFLHLTPYGWQGTDRPSDWKQIYTGTSIEALSKTTTTSITVPSNVYAGKTIAVEIRYGSTSANSYTNKIVFVTLGTNSSTTASKTYPRYVSFSEWDGTYLKNISTKCYVTTTSSTTSIIFGHLKTLIGSFSGTSIEWTTQDTDSLNVYIGKIWLVG